jgi:hypothetical protein
LISYRISVSELVCCLALHFSTIRSFVMWFRYCDCVDARGLNEEEDVSVLDGKAKSVLVLNCRKEPAAAAEACASFPAKQTP